MAQDNSPTDGSIDDRLDALEYQTKDLKSELQRLRVPFYKRWSFWGYSTGIVVVVLGWFWSHVAEDPEIPRLVHSNILMSDKALALQLKRNLSDGDVSAPLFRQISAQVGHLLKNDDEAKTYLFDIAAKHGARTYSGSQIFQQHTIPIGSVRCQILADKPLWAAISKELPGRGPVSFEFERSCSSGDASGAQIVVPFADFSPLVLPFRAEEGDDVQLDLQILAQSFDADGTEIEISQAHSFVEGFLFPETTIEFGSPAVKNHLSTKIEVPAGNADQIIAINLTPDGEAKVMPDGSGTTSFENPFRIILFATITVIPKANL